MNTSKESIEQYLELTTKLSYAILNPLYMANPINTLNLKIPFKESYMDTTADFLETYQSYFPTECSMIHKIVFPEGEKKKKLDFSEYVLLKHILNLMIQNFESIIKKPQIFISHSSIDEPIVKLFVDLLSHIGISDKNLFCSSVPGYGIKQGGGNIYEYLKRQFLTRDVYVIFMLSEHYYKSPACLNEMGAAWVLQNQRQSILLPGFNYSKIDGAIDPRDICFKLDDISNRNHALTELKDNLTQFLGLEPSASTAWEYHRDNFLNQLDRVNMPIRP